METADFETYLMYNLRLSIQDKFSVK